MYLVDLVSVQLKICLVVNSLICFKVVSVFIRQNFTCILNKFTILLKDIWLGLWKVCRIDWTLDLMLFVGGISDLWIYNCFFRRFITSTLIINSFCYIFIIFIIFFVVIIIKSCYFRIIYFFIAGQIIEITLYFSTQIWFNMIFVDHEILIFLVILINIV